jgi:hypothetical protein
MHKNPEWPDHNLNMMQHLSTPRDQERHPNHHDRVHLKSQIFLCILAFAKLNLRRARVSPIASKAGQGNSRLTAVQLQLKAHRYPFIERSVDPPLPLRSDHRSRRGSKEDPKSAEIQADRSRPPLELLGTKPSTGVKTLTLSTLFTPAPPLDPSRPAAPARSASGWPGSIERKRRYYSGWRGVEGENTSH